MKGLRYSLEQMTRNALHSSDPAAFDRLAQGVVELYAADTSFQQHIRNRSRRVAERTGKAFDPANFDIETAQAYIADEIGFGSWGELIDAATKKDPDASPILFLYAIAAMERGDFTALEQAIGPDEFHSRIVDWFEAGLFREHRKTLNEILSAACMLGQTSTAEYLIEKGVDPYAGMRTGLAGPHYAVSSARTETLRMLLAKSIPLEVENAYGGTLLGQALWSAVNEHHIEHGPIAELLIESGAYVWPNTAKWWEEQDVPSTETKARIANALRKA